MKSLWRGTKVPQRLHFQTLLVAFFIAISGRLGLPLKVYRVTECMRMRGG